MGQPIAGRYKVLQRLGQGGHAVAFLARDLLLHQDVIVKAAIEDEAPLRTEYAVLGRLRHPNIAEVRDLVQADRLYLVQEPAPGEDFFSWCRLDPEPARIARGVAAVVRGLQYVHLQGLVHRDIKPENIRVGPGEAGGLPWVRLIDFGHAGGDAQPLAAGTPGYVAPEVLAGQAPSASSDLFAVGVMLYEICSGVRHEGLVPPTAEQARMAASCDSAGLRSLGELASDLVAVEPAQRPGAAELLDTLAKVCGVSLVLPLAELAGDFFPSPPLVGREEALRRLQAQVARLATGGGLLCISGAGKSALAAEACGLARLAGHRVISAASPQSLLRQLPDEGPEIEPREGAPRRLATRVARGLKTASRPTLLCLDGWSRDDPLTAALLRQLGVMLVEHRCLLVVCGEPPDADWEQLVLPPLTAAQVEELGRRMLPHLASEPPWLGRLHAASGGDPALVVELIRAQIEAGLPDRLVPLAREELLAQRLATLSSLQRRLLSTIAVAVRPVPPPVLAVVAPSELAALGQLLSRGFLAVGDEGVWPTSAALASRASGELGGDELTALHQRFADAWLALESADPAAVGHHLLHAGQVSAAASYLLSAKLPPEDDLARTVAQLSSSDPRWIRLAGRLARSCRARGESDRAQDIARRVVEVAAEEGALLTAELSLDAGEPRAALDALGQINASSERVWLMRARAWILLGEFQKAAAAAESGLALPGLGARLRGSLGNAHGLALAYLGRALEAVPALRAAEAEARALDDEELLARVLNSLSIALLRCNRLGEAQAAQHESVGLFRRVGDWRLAATSAVNLGTLAQRRLQLGRALGHYRAAQRWGQRAGLGTTYAWALANEGNLLAICGAFDEAEERLRQALCTAEEEGARSLCGHALLYLSEVALRRGELGQARSLLGRAEERFDPSDRTGLEAAAVLAAELDLAQGDVEGARRGCAAVLGKPDAEDADRWRVHLVAARCERGGQPPRLAEAAAHLERALALTTPAEGAEVPQGGGLSERSWEIHADLAQLYRELERVEDAERHAERHEETLASLRRQIPPEHRERFDARADVEAARRRVAHRVPPAISGAGVQRLLELNRDLNQGLPLKQLWPRLLDRAIELVGAERGFVLLGEGAAAGRRLRPVASRNVEGEGVRRMVAKFSRSIAAEVTRRGRTLVLADAGEDRGFGDRRSVARLRLRSVLCAPLRVGGEIRGALYLDNRFRQGAFSAATVALAEAFAEQAGVAIRNAELLEHARERAEELRQAQAQLEALNGKLAERVSQQTTRLEQMDQRLRHEEGELVRRYNAADLVGSSPAMRALFLKMDRVAATDVPVVIHGESGTGKELVARAIHYNSARGDQPFVAVNCAAVPTTLLESELFGHVAGAFTGAVRDRPGVFEVAGGGTLLLDEIGDMPREMQVKLLRVLQDGTFRRLGDRHERSGRCRVLAASHKQLASLVESGAFREDLFYRISVIELAVPPLRARREDIPVLAEHLLAREGGEGGPPSLSPAALAALIDYDWPGNVRQLANELKRAAVLGGAESIALADLSPELRRQGLPATAEGEAPGLREAVKGYERRLIESALAQTRFNVSRAAERLQLNRVVLYRKMRAHGITRGEKKREVRR